ncbi:MAG TPA: hypothetical protein DHW20_01750 [Gemmatimonadetes bacterium]|nr:hypothetical protein [Gemmatimonadota bacterium]|tara:strand:+ start:17254 stop:17748 length:495 start_codon:yes stop_codon:yes gene_type:complete
MVTQKVKPTTGNMEMWDSWGKTDPKFTKDVSYGKRKYTTVNAQYQIERATKAWGPYGTTWGLRDMKWEILDERDFMLFRAVFYYPGGSFEIFTDIKIGDDCMKKSQTDMTTKALSKLGMDAEIFKGVWDSKYDDDTPAAKYPRKKPSDQLKLSDASLNESTLGV